MAINRIIYSYFCLIMKYYCQYFATIPHDIPLTRVIRWIVVKKETSPLSPNIDFKKEIHPTLGGRKRMETKLARIAAVASI